MTDHRQAPPEPVLIIHGDPELKDIIPEYLANRKQDVTTIAQALAAGDLDTIRVLGHRMKGSGGGYGFDAITAIGDILEQAAQSANTAAIRQQLQCLADFVERVKVVYDGE